jgi:multimeric flavodoxin WrbA
MNGQMKTLIDRALPKYYTDVKISGKDFYFIATAAEEKSAMERTIDSLRGFTDCLPDAKIKGVIYGEKAWQLGDIQGNIAIQEAYEAGKQA